MLRFWDTVMVYKCDNGMVPSYLRCMLQTRSQLHNLNTRSNRLLEISLYRTATWQHSFCSRAACLWNSLPEWLKNNNFNLEHFKNELRSYLVEYVLGAFVSDMEMWLESMSIISGSFNDKIIFSNFFFESFDMSIWKYCFRMFCESFRKSSYFLHSNKKWN
jgi:hypothetical protein